MAFSVDNLIMTLDVANCGKNKDHRCNSAVSVTQGGKKGPFTAVLARYTQLPSGDRVYVEAEKDDKIYEAITIEGGNYFEPMMLDAKQTRKLKFLGTQKLKNLRGKDTALGIIIRQEPIELAETNSTDLKMGVQMLMQFVIRLDMLGFKDGGPIKISHSGTQLIEGQRYEQFIVTNMKSVPVALDLDGIMRVSHNRKQNEKLPVLFPSMLSAYRGGTRSFKLTVTQGSTVNLYVPVDTDCKGKSLQITGRVLTTGKKISSKKVELD
jgi:hypothetical protein